MFDKLNFCDLKLDATGQMSWVIIFILTLWKATASIKILDALCWSVCFKSIQWFHLQAECLHKGYFFPIITKRISMKGYPYLFLLASLCLRLCFLSHCGFFSNERSIKECCQESLAVAPFFPALPLCMCVFVDSMAYQKASLDGCGYSTRLYLYNWKNQEYWMSYRDQQWLLYLLGNAMTAALIAPKVFSSSSLFFSSSSSFFFFFFFFLFSSSFYFFFVFFLLSDYIQSWWIMASHISGSSKMRITSFHPKLVPTPSMPAVLIIGHWNVRPIDNLVTSNQISVMLISKKTILVLSSIYWVD